MVYNIDRIILVTAMIASRLNSYHKSAVPKTRKIKEWELWSSSVKNLRTCLESHTKDCYIATCLLKSHSERLKRSHIAEHCKSYSFFRVT